MEMGSKDPGQKMKLRSSNVKPDIIQLDGTNVM